MDYKTIQNPHRSCQPTILEIPKEPQPPNSQVACQPSGIQLRNPTHPWKNQYTSRHIITTTRSRPGPKYNQHIIVIPPEKFTKIATTTTPEVAKETKHSLITLVYNHYTAGHPGRDETIRKAKQHASWDWMNSWIADYIKGCATCQQNKIFTHKRKIPLYRISTKEHTLPFQQIAMDLITGLLPCKGKDAILTIIDHRCS